MLNLPTVSYASSVLFFLQYPKYDFAILKLYIVCRFPASVGYYSLLYNIHHLIDNSTKVSLGKCTFYTCSPWARTQIWGYRYHLWWLILFGIFSLLSVCSLCFDVITLADWQLNRGYHFLNSPTLSKSEKKRKFGKESQISGRNAKRL